MLRRALIAAAVCAIAGVLGAPAKAARPVTWNHVVPSAHFLVHYNSDTNSSDFATLTQASDTATLFERAYAAELKLGFAAPLDDGDGKVDVYIQSVGANILGAAFADNPAGPTSPGYIELDPGSLTDLTTISHELFHLIQFATWVPTVKSDGWLLEGSAEWMGAKIDGYQAADVAGVGPSDLPLDCRENLPGGALQMCDVDFSIEGGYSRWPFFEALAQRYGPTFLQTVLANGAAGSSAISALSAAIGSRGGTLADVYNDWAVRQMGRSYGITALDALSPTAYTAVATGVSSATVASLNVNVGHLAARYVKFTRGDGAADHACYSATLTLKVTIPSGVTSRPFFFWNQQGSVPVELPVSGNVAEKSVPWDTCAWQANAGYLALPNDTTSVDAADFHLDATLTVDPTKPASATAPPSQGSIYGGQTNVADADLAPTISLFGPLVLKVASSDPVLRLIVESTDVGKVHALLGTVDLGTRALRTGNNDLRFAIPKSLRSRLRRSAASGGNVLSLTPLSASGAATGDAVTRLVTLTATPRKRTKPKK